MRKYLMVLRQSILDSLAFGPVAFVWILVEFFGLLAPLAIWYGSTPISGSFGGYAKTQILFYYALAAIVTGFTSWYIHFPVSRDVRSGDISNDLVKPIPVLNFYIFSEMGWKVMRTFVQIPLIIVISTLLISSLQVHQYSLSPLFFLALIIGSLMSLLISSCFAALSFWVTELSGLMGIYFFVVYMFSGELAPLSVYPVWFRQLAEILPFRYLLSFPLELFFGKLNLLSAAKGFSISLIWLLVLFFLTRYLWRRGLVIYQAYGK